MRSLLRNEAMASQPLMFVAMSACILTALDS
jgi:hypothetical protein